MTIKDKGPVDAMATGVRKWPAHSGTEGGWLQDLCKTVFFQKGSVRSLCSDWPQVMPYHITGATGSDDLNHLHDFIINDGN